MRTAELTGAALDWAVAKCEGVNAEAFRLFYEPTEPSDYDSHGYPEFHYSTTWSQGGPIIERERIDLLGAVHGASGPWTASIPQKNRTGWRHLAEGPTPLIAAMRCYIARKLGDEVDVPDEFC